jgi:hypothetical protein
MDGFLARRRLVAYSVGSKLSPPEGEHSTINQLKAAIVGARQPAIVPIDSFGHLNHRTGFVARTSTAGRR